MSFVQSGYTHPYVNQGSLSRTPALIFITPLVSWQLTDVRRIVLKPTCSVIRRGHMMARLTAAFGFADHTKYIGKSAGHKHDVKFSEDGETVVEGEDIE